MKSRNLLFVVLIFVCTCSFAWAQTYLVNYKLSNIEGQRFQYDEEGKLTTIYYDEYGEVDAKEVMTYNELGQCVRIDAYQFSLDSENEWFHANYVTFDYDERGNVKARKNFNHDPFDPDAGLVQSATITYFYDEENRRIREEQQFVFDEYPFYRETYTYNEKGQLIKSMGENNANWWGEPLWELEGMRGYTYTDAGCLAIDSSLVVDYSTGELTDPGNKYTYTYDENNNLILDEYFMPGGAMWSIQKYSEHSYNKDILAEDYVYPYHPEMTGREYMGIVNERTESKLYMRDLDTGEIMYVGNYTYTYEKVISTYTITFKVVDADSKEPIKDATVTFEGEELEDYAIQDIQAGTYSYTVTKKDYHAKTGSVVVVDEDMTVTVELKAQNYTVTFKVVDKDSKKPVDGAAIVFDGVGLTGYVASTVKPGTYSYTVTKEGYEPASGEVVVTDSDATTTVELQANVGVESNTLSAITLYPNPFGNRILLSDPSSVRSIQIINALGQKVKDVAVTGNTINTERLPAGIYIMVVEGFGGEKEARKMIKR